MVQVTAFDEVERRTGPGVLTRSPPQQSRVRLARTMAQGQNSRTHLVFDGEGGWPGSYATCPVCYWEEDLVQFRWPTMAGGANRVSLVEAQYNFQSYGACDQRGRRFVRPAAPDEPVDPGWHPIDLARDLFEDRESDGHRPWPEDKSLLCW